MFSKKCPFSRFSSFPRAVGALESDRERLYFFQKKASSNRFIVKFEDFVLGGGGGGVTGEIFGWKFDRKT